MKKLLLLLCVFSGYIASASKIQIDFITGFDVYITDTSESFPTMGSTTSDANINAILSTHGVNSLLLSSGDSYVVILADYNGANLVALVNDLLENSNINRVRRCYDNGNDSWTYADKLYVKLFSSLDGNPTGTNANGNVITSNNTVNIIFDTYNVKSMSPLISLYYTIFFEGDITGLKNELDNMTNVIDFTELIGVPVLGNSEFEKPKTIISPNPFSNHFNIETDQLITNYAIIDLTGKTIVLTASKNELDFKIEQLNSGLYILNLQFENGKTVNHKLVKK